MFDLILDCYNNAKNTLFISQACIIHNMILRYNGLDRLWEDEINWNNLDPNGNDNNDDADAHDEYVPVIHSEATFVPTYVHLIPIADRTPYQQDRQDFQTLQTLLANHLQIMYCEGKLRWPKL